MTMKLVSGFLLTAMSMEISSTLGLTHDYADALSKSILFFEGQRSGKLPPAQRAAWRQDSALRDGAEINVDLVGGYYDAGDNVKFNFPMAFSVTMLAWSIIEFKTDFVRKAGPDLGHALDAVRWGTDYLMKSTSVPGVVFALVGEPYRDHDCWERPEDMDTPRTPYNVSKKSPGSEVAGETAAALAASSIAFRAVDRLYAARLLTRAKMVFEFADKYRGSYNDGLGKWVCPFYCDYSGYEDELIWAAAWLFKATKLPYYWDYIIDNMKSLRRNIDAHNFGSFGEFGWDAKHAGINVLLSKFVLRSKTSAPSTLVADADRFICSVLPESPSVSVSYSPGGLLFKPGGSNTQHVTASSFLLLVYGRYIKGVKRVIDCGNGVVGSYGRLKQLARSQVDYILGTNPMNMSYMVGYGSRYPRRIHHRGASLPSVKAHPAKFGCQDGSRYYTTEDPNPNDLVGAVVGGPDKADGYADSRADFVHSEPTTYINAPLVGLLAFFNAHPKD